MITESSRGLALAIVVILIVFNTIPYLWLFIGSFLPNTETDRGISIPSLQMITISNYLETANYSAVIKHLWNTVRVSVLSALIVTASTALAGYGLTRFANEYLGHSRVMVIAGYLLSPVIIVIPYAVMLDSIGHTGSIMGLTLANTAFCFPFGFYLMISYMDEVSRKFDMSAAIDGAGWWHTFSLVILPRTFPGLVAVAMFSFILSWNDVALATVLANADSKTLVVWLKEQIMELEETQYGLFAAASIWVAFIAIIIFGFAENWIDNRMKRERSGRG